MFLDMNSQHRPLEAESPANVISPNPKSCSHMRQNLPTKSADKKAPNILRCVYTEAYDLL
jgi:hypothetical protein